MSVGNDDGQHMNTSSEASERSDDTRSNLRDLLRETSAMFLQAVAQQKAEVRARETGTVMEVTPGIANVVGLPHVQSDELLRFAGNQHGFAFNLDRHEVGCVLLDESENLQAGTSVERTGRVLDTPVGEELLGRVIDPIGRPLDGGHRLTTLKRMPCERDAPGIMRRDAVSVPLQTGSESDRRVDSYRARPKATYSGRPANRQDFHRGRYDHQSEGE